MAMAPRCHQAPPPRARAPVAWVEHEVDRAPQQSAFDRSWTSDEEFSEFRLSVGVDVVQFEQVLA